MSTKEHLPTRDHNIVESMIKAGCPTYNIVCFLLSCSFGSFTVFYWINYWNTQQTVNYHYFKCINIFHKGVLFLCRRRRGCVVYSPLAYQQTQRTATRGPCQYIYIDVIMCCVWEVRWEAREKARWFPNDSGNLSTEITQRPFWDQRGHNICQRQKQLQLCRNTRPRLIADICEVWGPAPSISVGSQHFIFPHFSERGKYDSTYRLLHKCVA